MSSELRLAVVNVSTRVAAAEVERVVRSCQVQLETQLAPAWRTQARVEVWPDLACLPDGAFPVLVADDEEQIGALGHHDPTRAMVGVDDASLMGVPWSCVLSHELCEAAVNPALDRWIAQPSSGVEWAAEICDPVENQRYVVEGVAVSDFVLPAFFDEGAAGQRLNWRGTLPRPFSVEPPNGHAVTRRPGEAAGSFPEMPMLAWRRSSRSRRQRLLGG